MVSPLNGIFKILYVGRFIYWKGMHLGLKAFSGYLKKYPNSILTMIGEGPDINNLKKYSFKLGIDKNVIWKEWINHDDLKKQYQNYDIFFYPSFHDSGGMVILESLSSGLPVVCLDLGGPGQIVNSTCGQAIKVNNKKINQVVSDLSEGLINLSNQILLNSDLNSYALKRAHKFTWNKLIKKIYEEEKFF